MGKQVLATIRMPNSSSTEQRSFLSDLLLIKENVGNDDYPATLFFFGNLSNPLGHTEKWEITETVSELVSSADNSLVLGTVTAINQSGQIATSEYAFPCAGYTIKTTSVTYAESIINYRQLDYYVEETQSELVDAANAGGGGGGGDTLFALTGSNTATGDVVGDLDGNNLNVEQDGNNWLQVQTSAGVERVVVQSFSSETVGASSGFSINSNSDGGYKFLLQANDAINVVQIEGDAAGNSMTYTAGVHNFSGKYGYDGDGALFHQMGFDDVKWFSKIGVSTGPEMQLTETSFTVLLNDGAMIDVVYDEGDETTNIKMTLLEFADDAAAATGGVPVTGLYRTGSVVKIRVS